MEKGLTLSLGRFSLLRASQTSEHHRLLPQLIPQLSEVKDVPAPPPLSDDGFSDATNEQTSNPLQRGLALFCKKCVSEVVEWRFGEGGNTPASSADCAFYTCFLHMFLFHNLFYNRIFQMYDEV